jgi:putative transposase
MPLYHVWFGTKRRKWLLQGDVGEAARELMIQVAAEKGIDLIECEGIVDHVHLLLRVADQSELSKVMNSLKGVTLRRLFERFPDLRMDSGVNNFWQHRYGARCVPDGASRVIGGYISTQWGRLEKYDRV